MKKNRHNLGILWLSVSPHIRSGYGQVTKNITFRLAERGWPIVIVAYYGLHDGGMLKLGGIPILPIYNNERDYGKKSVPYYLEQFGLELPILFSDFWRFDWFPKLENSTFYGPIDHCHYGLQHVKTLKRYQEFITISKFGQKEARKYGRLTKVIPHGVDTKVFRPLNKFQCRDHFNFRDDVFIIGIVAANNDPEPRKGWDKMFLGYKIFLDNFPKLKKKTYIFAYTKPQTSRGFDLPGLSQSIGIDKNVFFPDRMTHLIGLPESEMAMLYNSFDILLNTSRREGFGLPILEAQSCGVPVIGTKFSSMLELIRGHGWLVKSKDWMYTPLNGKCAVPSEDDIAKKLEQAYFEKELRNKYANLGRKFALKYDWDLLIKRLWEPWLEEKENELTEKEVAPKTLDISLPKDWFSHFKE
ncbi:MAG: glycosyltransferase family 4 protein [Candidatus Hodarchaeales archaeon]